MAKEKESKGNTNRPNPKKIAQNLETHSKNLLTAGDLDALNTALAAHLATHGVYTGADNMTDKKYGSLTPVMEKLTEGIRAYHNTMKAAKNGEQTYTDTMNQVPELSSRANEEMKDVKSTIYTIAGEEHPELDISKDMEKVKEKQGTLGDIVNREYFGIKPKDNDE